MLREVTFLLLALLLLVQVQEANSQNKRDRLDSPAYQQDEVSATRRLQRKAQQRPLKVFAVATDTGHPNFHMFNNSASKSGLNIELLGVGK